MCVDRINRVAFVMKNTSAYYFDKITVDPSDSGKLENESADGYNDNIVFATNETGSRSDSVRMYTADQVSF